MKYILYVASCLLLGFGCTSDLPQAVDGEVTIFPDYEGVTVPQNIAPLNFKLPNEQMEGKTLLKTPHEELIVSSKDGVFNIPISKWKHLLQDAKGGEIEVAVYFKNQQTDWKIKRFAIYVSKDSIDGYLTYRRIYPGYRMWGEMGIYQRSVENFVEKPVISNRGTGNSCVNCHSFCAGNGNRMMFHQRSNYAGTYLVDGKNVEKIAVEENGKPYGLTYPYWHPSGKYIAFSSNETHQDFHYSDKNRIEVYDMASDIIIYNVEKRKAFTIPTLSSLANYETFPTFTTDGKTLLFCSADSVQMPTEFRNVRYNLLKIAFDPATGSFASQVDTLYNANKQGKSATFPRVSPDGKYLLYTLSDYGNFSIWHREADLKLLDLATGETDSLSQVNSLDVESYHSWSSNSRWFVFASRRLDGQFTRPFIVHIDEQGHCSKPFLLPQESSDYYDRSLFSFNIPELSKTATSIGEVALLKASKSLPTRKVELERYENQ